MDIKNLRRFISQQGGTPVATTVLRAENIGMGALYNNLKINGTSISEIKKACMNMNEKEFTQHIANLLKQFGGETSSESFVGTSLNLNAFIEYTTNYPIRYQIFCPQGTQGAFIENLFAQGTKGYVDTSAAEFVLQAGSKFKITDAWMTNDGALAICADVLEKAVDATGKSIWKKVAAVAIPLSLAALSASATTPQTENNTSNTQHPASNNKKPNDNNTNQPFNNNNDYNNNNTNSPKDNNNVQPTNPNITPPNNTPDINLPDMSGFNTPDFGKNNSEFNNYTTEYNGGNVNDYKPHSTDGQNLNRPIDDIIKEQTNEHRNNAINALKEIHGDDAVVDVKVTHTIDKNGNITYHVEALVTKNGKQIQNNNTNPINGNNNGTGTGNGVGSGNNSVQGNNNNNDDKAKAEAEAKKKADKQLQDGLDWTNKNFTDADGNFDGNSFADWVNDTYGEGQAYNYTGSGAQNAYNAALNAQQSGNWDNFYNNAGNYNNSGEDWSWTGFDVTATGGNPYGGGIVYNEYGQIDYRNSWFSFGGSGGGGNNTFPEEHDHRDREEKMVKTVDAKECI